MKTRTLLLVALAIVVCGCASVGPHGETSEPPVSPVAIGVMAIVGLITGLLLGAS